MKATALSIKDEHIAQTQDICMELLMDLFEDQVTSKIGKFFTLIKAIIKIQCLSFLLTIPEPIFQLSYGLMLIFKQFLQAVKLFLLLIIQRYLFP